MINKLDKCLTEDNMSLGELWETLASISGHIRCDNLQIVDDSYPLLPRKMQLDSIKSLIKEIEKHHDNM